MQTTPQSASDEPTAQSIFGTVRILGLKASVLLDVLIASEAIQKHHSVHPDCDDDCETYDLLFDAWHLSCGMARDFVDAIRHRLEEKSGFSDPEDNRSDSERLDFLLDMARQINSATETPADSETGGSE